MKKRQVVLYIIVMLILLTTSVYATISAELNFKVSSNGGKDFYPGDEFTLTIGLKNIDASEGIKSIEGYIDIDENVFENLSVDSIVTNENGKVEIGTNNELIVYDANNISSDTEKGIILNTNPVSEKGDYKIVINLENPVSSNTDLVTLKFKIKEDVAPGGYESVMKYKIFKVFSDSGEKLELDEKPYRIDISAKPTENEVANNTANIPTNNSVNKSENNTTNNTVNNTINNNTVNNVVKNNTINNVANKASGGTTQNKNSGTPSTQSKVDKTVSPTKLPKTGYRVMLIPIIAMAIVGLVFYKKYSKYNNYHE